VLRLRLGTRRSALARRQAELVASALAAHHARLEIEVALIESDGDREPDLPFELMEGMGWFTASLERALLDGRIDLGRADVVPLYVATSAFTHELTEDAVARWADARHRAATPTASMRVLPPLDERAFAELSARYIRQEISRRGLGPMNEWALVLAAHGTLLDPPRPMETGREATERIAGMIRAELVSDFGFIGNGWLNHV